ncbi:hypothetical protein STEG23_033027 [Scotinomys teguina]
MGKAFSQLTSQQDEDKSILPDNPAMASKAANYFSTGSSKLPCSCVPYARVAATGFVICPTCLGNGEIPQELEKQLIALIPYGDQRLKPRHTKLSVCLAVIICLLTFSLTIFFLYPRSIVVYPVGLTSSKVTFDEAHIRLNMTNILDISNSNFYPITVTQLTAEVLHQTSVVGQVTSSLHLHIGPLATEQQNLYVAESQSPPYSSAYPVRLSTRHKALRHQAFALNSSRCQELANYYFGFNGWSKRILKLQELSGVEDEALTEPVRKQSLKFFCAVEVVLPSYGCRSPGVGIAEEPLHQLEEGQPSFLMKRKTAQKLAIQSALSDAFQKLTIVVLESGKVAVEYIPSEESIDAGSDEEPQGLIQKQFPTPQRRFSASEGGHSRLRDASRRQSLGSCGREGGLHCAYDPFDIHSANANSSPGTWSLSTSPEFLSWLLVISSGTQMTPPKFRFRRPIRWQLDQVVSLRETDTEEENPQCQ